LNLHLKKSNDAKNAFTTSEHEQVEKLNGARYTELSRLPYLNIICHVIDPMHNLFLGLAKHVTKLIPGKILKLPVRSCSLVSSADTGSMPSGSARELASLSHTTEMLSDVSRSLKEKDYSI